MPLSPHSRSLSMPGMGDANPGDGAPLVFVPEGRFTMGSDRESTFRLWHRHGWDQR